MSETKQTVLALMDPNLERTFRGHKSYITSVAFSPSLKQLASGSGDNSVMLWNFKPQLRAFKFIGHKGVVTDVKFSPEGDVLASASKDKTVRIWIPSAKGESVTMKGHAAAVRSVNFSHDSRYLITASDDKTAKIWSLPSRKFAASLVGHSNWVRSAVFDPTGKLAVTGSDDKQVKLWDVASRQALHTFYDHNDVVNCVQFHPDGSCVASGSADRTIKMWDIRSHQLIQHYGAHTDGVTSISMHPSGYYLVSTSRDSSIKIWDLREGRLLFTLQGHVGAVNAAAFSQDGHFFSSGGADQMVMVWKANLVGLSPTPTHDWRAEVKPKWSAGASVRSGISMLSMSRIERDSINTTQSTLRRPRSADMSAASPKPAFGSSQPAPRKPSQSGMGAKELSLTGSSDVVKGTPLSSRSPHADSHTSGPRSVPYTLRGAGGHVPGSGSGTGSGPPKSPSALFAHTVRNQQTPSAPADSPQKKKSDTSAGQDRDRYISRDQLPEALAGTLDHIIGQLDIITRTMSILENRLTLSEDRISTIIAHTRGLGEIPVAIPSHAKTSAYLEYEQGDAQRLNRSEFTSGNLNLTAVSGLTPSAANIPAGNYSVTKIFDDRTYNEVHSRGGIECEDSFARNVPRFNESFQNNVSANDESFSRVAPSTNSWMRPSALTELQKEDQYVREEKRLSGVEDMGEYYADNDGDNSQYVVARAASYLKESEGQGLRQGLQVTGNGVDDDDENCSGSESEGDEEYGDGGEPLEVGQYDDKDEYEEDDYEEDEDEQGRGGGEAKASGEEGGLKGIVGDEETLRRVNESM